jgi:hypothetical protein
VLFLIIGEAIRSEMQENRRGNFLFVDEAQGLGATEVRTALLPNSNARSVMKRAC